MDDKIYVLSEKEKLARTRLCLPLDGIKSLDDAKTMIEELSEFVGLFKIGKESFTSFGPELVKMVHDSGSKVFLDLKYYDIPNTVKGAAKSATKLGVYMFNVHASGGYEMMKAAVEGVNETVKENEERPVVIGVTILTSFDLARVLHANIGLIKSLQTIADSKKYESFLRELKDFDLKKYIDLDMERQAAKAKKSEFQKSDEFAKMDEHFKNEIIKKYGLNNLIPNLVRYLAEVSLSAGLDGIVCSADDLTQVKDHLPKKTAYVTPGIQGPNIPAGADQKRVLTPGNAIIKGSSILVVGRAITSPKTREERRIAAYEVLQDMAREL